MTFIFLERAMYCTVLFVASRQTPCRKRKKKHKLRENIGLLFFFMVPIPRLRRHVIFLIPPFCPASWTSAVRKETSKSGLLICSLVAEHGVHIRRRLARRLAFVFIDG